MREAALRAELQRHAARLKEIDAMSAQFALFDTYLPELEKAGVKPCDRARSVEWAGFERALYVSGTDFFGENRKLNEVLLFLGFKEVKRTDHISFASVILSKGRLRISFHLWPQKVIDPKPTAPTKELSNEVSTAT